MLDTSYPQDAKREGTKSERTKAEQATSLQPCALAVSAFDPRFDEVWRTWISGGI